MVGDVVGDRQEELFFEAEMESDVIGLDVSSPWLCTGSQHSG